MICFDHLALSDDILTALRELNIDYVFQPIFEKDKKTVYAWEALMRPVNLTVTDLISKYQGVDKLHVIEVATFFGAMQAYFMRGYTERVAINCDDARIPDNEGNQPVDQPVFADGANAYFSTLPIKKMVEYMKKANVPLHTGSRFLPNTASGESRRMIGWTILAVSFRRAARRFLILAAAAVYWVSQG